MPIEFLKECTKQPKSKNSLLYKSHTTAMLYYNRYYDTALPLLDYFPNHEFPKHDFPESEFCGLQEGSSQEAHSSLSFSGSGNLKHQVSPTNYVQITSTKLNCCAKFCPHNFLLTEWHYIHPSFYPHSRHKCKHKVRSLVVYNLCTIGYKCI